ncbi:hypothetical protein C8A00DRAFT_16997, partial [Chaetomidium leptoderma]
VSGPVESFDARGDLILVAGEPGVNFRVCSRSLARSSPAWDRKLYGLFSKPNVHEDAHAWVIRLPEDNALALRIILQAVHYKFNDMPTILSRDILFQVTVLCEKYDMMGLLKPFWSGWITHLPQLTLDPETLVQQVWIAHKLGHLQSYEDILVEFLCSAQKRAGTNDTRLFLEGHPEFDPYKDPHLQALGLLKSWELGRLEMIIAIGKRLTTAMETYSNPKITTCGFYHDNADWRLTCDCAMLGGLHRALHGRVWYSSGQHNWEKQVTLSARQLITKMEGLRTTAIGNSRMRRRQGDAHKTCTPWVKFELADILRGCPIGSIVPLGRATFAEQAEKSGLKAQGLC